METTPERLKSHVYTLAAEIGEHNVFRPQALYAAAEYIEQQWRRQGYQVTPYLYPVQGVQCANLEITRYGTRRADEILLIGAHYDSVIGSPGANDNGSGVAALLEISRLFTSVDPSCTVRFVAFVNEEPPFFMGEQMGSLVYARMAHQRGDVIRLMASLETIGYYSNEPGSQHYPPVFRFFYPEQGNFIAFVSNLYSRKMMHCVVQAFRKHSTFPSEYAATFAFIPGVAWSDHVSFWKQGYRAFMVTDTAFYRYAYYHSAEDTPDKLRYQPFAHVTTGLYRAFADLAGHP